MIVTIIADTTAAIGGTPAPTFYHAEQFEQNYNDDATLPMIYLEHPIKGADTILPQGNQETTYTLNIFFLDKTGTDGIAETILTKQTTIDAMHALKRKFILRLRNDSRVKEIKGSTHTEIYNLLDLNLDGLWLTLTVVTLDTAAVCLT